MHRLSFEGCVALTLAGLQAAVSTSSYADEDSGDLDEVAIFERAEKNAELYNLNTEVPTSPAFTLLGVTGTDVINPADGKQFAVSVINNISEDGGFSPGIAIDTQPYWWGQRDLSISDYRRLSSFERILARTKFSFATAESGQENDDSVRAAIGLYSTLLDGADPRMDGDYTSCLQGHTATYALSFSERVDLAVKKIKVDLGLGEDADDPLPGHAAYKTFQAAKAEAIARIREEMGSGSDFSRYKKGYDACVTEAGTRYAQKHQLMIGLGAKLIADSGQLDELDYDGFSAWAAWKIPFCSSDCRNSPLSGFSATVYGRYITDETIVVDEDTSRDASTFVGAVAIGKASEVWTLELNASYNRRDFSEPMIPSDSFWRYSGKFAYKFSKKLWLEAGAGFTRGNNLDDQSFVSVNLKVDLNTQLADLVGL